MTLKPNDTVEEVFYVSHKSSGLYRYEVRADALPGEVTTVNNTAPLLLRVVDQPIRVLLLEGKPYWDTKFLVRTLSADPSIELTSVVQLAEGRLLRRKIAAPAAGDEKSQPGTDTPRRPRIRADAGKRPATAVAAGDRRSRAMGHRKGRRQVPLRRRRPGHVSNRDPRPQRRSVFDRRRPGEAAEVAREGEGSLVCFRGPPASQISQRLGELMPMRWTPAAESRFHVAIDRRRPGVAMAAGLGRWKEPTGRSALAGHHDSAGGRQGAGRRAGQGRRRRLGPAEPRDGLSAGRQRPGGRRRRGRHVALGLPRARTSDSKRKSTARCGGASSAGWCRNVGLLPSQRLALRADKLSFTTDENVTATLLVRDWSGEPPQVELDAADRSMRPRDRSVCVPRGSYPGPVLRRAGPAARGAILAARGGHRQERRFGRGGLRRPRKSGRAARRLRPAERDEDDRPGERRRGPGNRPIRACWRNNSTSTSAAPGPNARRRPWPGTAGGCCSGRLPSGARPGGSAADRDWCKSVGVTLAE